MSVMVRPNASVLTDMATQLGSALWTATKFHLCKLDIDPTLLTTLAELEAEEADFGGYAAASLTFGTPYVDAAGNPQAVANAVFIATSAATPNTLYTWYLTNTAETVLIGSGRLDNTPVTIINTGDGIALNVIVGLGVGEVVTIG